MKPSEELFARLVRLAKRAPAETAPDEMPLGLATRVLARLREPELASPWERLGLASLPFGAATAALCLWLSFHEPQALAPDDQQLVQFIVSTQLEP